MRGLLGKLVACVLAGLLASSAHAQGSATRPQVPLPEGPLRNVILKNCVQCHGIDDYAFFALERDRWESLLEEKHVGMPVNKLAASDHNLLLDYLAETFGTESNPFPREYVPPEIDEFFGEEEGRLALDSTCTECHGLDRIYETRGTLERWRVLMLEMRSRGAFFDNDIHLEQMAEWLSRVQSANLFE